jgi:hypothetical protein
LVDKYFDRVYLQAIKEDTEYSRPKEDPAASETKIFVRLVGGQISFSWQDISMI